MSSTDSFSEAIEAALNGEAMLFTGAGFSYGAVNVNGTSPKSGVELAQELASDCGIDEDTFLDEAAGFFMEDHGTDALIERIRPLYSISSVAEHHSILAAIPWQRVYTTNYDDVYETACAQLPRVFQPLTLQHLPRDVSFTGNDCIHLNGFIGELNRQTIQSSFKLTRASYLTDSLLENPWLQVFRGDLDIAQAVFFVGYSMYDLDIARLLFSTESLREKSFFVTSKTPSRKSRRSLEQFGTVAPIGVDGFAHMVGSAKASFTPKATNTPILASFDQAITHDPGTRPLKDSDVFRLLLYGDVAPEYVWESTREHPSHNYTVRRSVLDRLIESVQTGCGTTVVHSHLGNGKTILIEQLRCWAAERGLPIFIQRRIAPTTLKETRYLANRESPTLVVLDDYGANLDLVEEIANQRRDELSLVLTSRTTAHDLKHKQLRRIVTEFEEIDANRLQDSDVEGFSQMLSSFGLWGDQAGLSESAKLRTIKGDCNSQIHAVLLKLLESPDIRNRLCSELDEVKTNVDVYRLLVTVFVLQSLGIRVTGDLLIDLVGPNVQSRLRQYSDSVAPFIDVHAGEIRARSSVLSEFILQQLADAPTVIAACIRITRSAASKGSGLSGHSVFYDILREVVRFSNLQSIVPEQGRRQAIIDYYESVKNISRHQKHPHFWLQYAVARVTLKDWTEAEQFFKTSYSLAGRRAGYDTSFIDNHFARFLLSRSIAEMRTGEAMAAFDEAAKILTKQARDSDNRHYPYRVAALFNDFDLRFSAELSASERSRILGAGKRVLEEMSTLPPRIQEHYSVRDCRHRLNQMMERATK